VNIEQNPRCNSLIPGSKFVALQQSVQCKMNEHQSQLFIQNRKQRTWNVCVSQRI